MQKVLAALAAGPTGTPVVNKEDLQLVQDQADLSGSGWAMLTAQMRWAALRLTQSLPVLLHVE
jgi:hypothetical protein